MSQQQAQIDAVESLLIALLKNNQMSFVSHKVFDDAHSRIMSEDGPPGTSEKTAAADYLGHLKTLL
ncbi:hypothetical protein [Pseudomonas abietaniphila]|uniref:Uncharacterized protein n=1 Tax=Pseudomonas abietaniphila TaxID=89065 RepID=A0A1G8TFG8_9PSED|nr:hypothetical protein [Pseudomonas abietaniphila]SDJ40258.1 hypothetical protein SAMN05216605_12863 [Pseudomonas abietaniphila]